MSGTPAYRPAGQTVALSVVATSHAAVPIVLKANDMAQWLCLFNSGSVAVAVHLSVAGDAATLPVDGTPGDFVLPPAMSIPVVIPLPSGTGPGGPCNLTAIGATAGPSLIYATPVVMQD